MTTRIAALTIVNPTAVARTEDVLVGGAQLPEGAVTDPTRLALTRPDGSRLPCQALPLARWADGSVKWALFVVPGLTLAGGERMDVHLTLDEPQPLSGVSVARTADGLAVSNGLVRLAIADHGALVPTIESRVGGQWVPRAANLDLAMTVERAHGQTRYLASRAPRTVTVEEEAPCRVVIRIQGTHRAEADETVFGPYTLRLELLTGSRQVRLTHSFVYDGDPAQDFVRASELLVRALVGGDCHFGFGADDGREVRFARQRAPVWTPDFRYAELAQEAPTYWRVRRWVDLNRREVFAAEGQHADGWMELTGDQGRFGAMVRDFWQQYPKALAADAATGDLRIGLYPSRAARLDLQRYSDLIYPHTYEAPCTWKKEVLPVNPADGAHGIRKTHDVVLFVDEPNPAGAAHACQHPLLLQWAPAYLAQTGAVVPATTQIDPTWNRRMQGFLDFLNGELRHAGATGYLDYFDLPHGFNVEECRWYHDFGGFGYNNDEAMTALGLWQAYLLTGRPDAFALARAMTRHHGDVDSYHLGRWTGYGTRHNVNHWGDACKERRVSQPVGKRFLYYLTGDRSVLDLADVVLARFRRDAAQPREHNMTCDIPALVAVLLLAEETGMAPVAPWLHALADALAAAVDEHGCLCSTMTVDSTRMTAQPGSRTPISFMMFSCFGGAQSFAELAERYHHEPLRQALVRFARYQMRPRAERCQTEGAGSFVFSDHLNTFRALDLLAYAYAVTGDPAFVEHVRRYTTTVCVELQERPSLRYGVPAPDDRLVPVSVPWPDQPPEAAADWQRWYPLFPPTSAGQLFEMSVYLHKMQGLMLLATTTH